MCLGGLVGSVLVVVGLLGCGGSDSMLPPAVRDSMEATQAAIEQGEGADLCPALMATQSALYDWQSYARGNQPIMVERFLQSFEALSYECSMVQTDQGEEIDIAALSEKYTEWSGQLRKDTTRKSGFSLWLYYILIPAVLGGILMFWRRRFREA